MGNSETMVNYVKTITDEEELYRCISFYDWDEGYEVPKAVSENQYCTLPVALLIDTAVNSAIDLNSFSKGVCNRYNCANVNFEEKIYPPCFMDQCGYTVFIKEIEKEKKSQVAKLFLVDTDELIRIMKDEKSLQTAVNLFDAIRLEQELEKIGVEAMIIPRIEEKYPKIHTCRHIKIKVED